MGLGGISIWELVLVLGIVVMIFGTKRLRNMGGDLGSAIKGFRSAMKEGGHSGKDGGEDKQTSSDEPRVINHADKREDATDQQAHTEQQTQDSDQSR